MILIADSGSTKTLWVFRQNGMDILIKVTRGLNPNYTPEYVIEKTIGDLLKESKLEKKIKEVFFYGSGCGSQHAKNEIRSVLKAFLPKAKIAVETDLLAAARGICHNKPGIACILGTGSNACYTDGKGIISAVPSSGYIFGDNGGGVQIGKFILQAYLDGDLPKLLTDKLEQEYKINREVIIKKVYKEASPNRFMASLAPFALANKKNKIISALLEQSFSLFFQKQVSRIPQAKKLPLHFTGSVALAFEKEIRAIAAAHKFKCGSFSKSPMQGLVNFHG